LSICQDDHLLPIGDVTQGDDPGHALTLELYSMLTGRPVNANDVSRINSYINLVGIALLAALLYQIGLSVAAFVVLVGAPMLANQYFALGPHPANLGVACLAALLPIAALTVPSSARRRFWIWLGVGLCSLAVAMLFREVIGLMGAVATIATAILRYGVLGSRTFRSLLGCIVIASLATGTIAVPKAILKTRDIAFDLKPSDMMQQHGAWHNLYIGLGAAENPFGLMWDDGVGRAAVKRIDPSVPYLSNAYYSILKHEYLNIVVHRPLEVFTVYLRKLRDALDNAHIGAFLAIIVVLVTIGRWRFSKSFAGWIAADGVLVVSVLFVAMFLCQAMLFHPALQYLFPIEVFLLVGAAVAAQLFVAVIQAERHAARVGKSPLPDAAA